MNVSTLLAGVISGLLLGGLYAIAALGLSLVFGVMRLVNIVHGEFLVNPLMHRGGEPPLLAAFGLSIIAQNVMLLIWGADARTLTTSYSNLGVSLFGVRVPLMYLIAFVLAIILIAAVQLFISQSYLGKAIRAATQDPSTAQVMGINPRTIYTFTYGIGAAIATLGGTLIGLIFSFTPTSGLTWLLKGFVVVVMGGMGSIVGILAAGGILGIAEGIGGAIVGTGYRDMIGFLIFLIVLVFWPRGLFGKIGRFA